MEENDVSKQVNDLLDGLVPDAPAQETELVQETSSEEVKADEQKGEERPEETPSGQEQVAQPAAEETKEEVKPPVEAKPAEEVKPPEKPSKDESELDKAKRELAETRMRLEEMAGRIISPPQPQRPPMTPEQQAAYKAEMEKRAKAAIKFLPDDASFDEVMKTADNFNMLLTKVANFAAERVLRMVPQVATTYVDQQLTYKTAAQEFYRENSDLVPHMKYVGFVSNELLAKNANWDLPTLLQATEKEVRARLKLPKGNSQVVKPGRRTETGTTHTVEANPGFVPGGGGGRRGSAQSPLSGQEKDIMDLIS
jgi:hypothetical protein